MLREEKSNGKAGVSELEIAGLKPRAAAKAPRAKQIEIEALKLGQASYTLVGVTPLLIQGKDHIVEDLAPGPKAKKRIQSKEEKFQQAIQYYVTPGAKDKIRVPAVWFEQMLALTASRFLGLGKEKAYGVVRMVEPWVALKHSKPYLREDIGRNPKTKGACLIHRGQIDKWECKIVLRFDAAVVNEQSLAEWLQQCGFSNGIGGWRPQKGGMFGQFEIGVRK